MEYFPIHIAGQDYEGDGANGVINPATGEVFATHAITSRSLLDLAISSGRTAQQKWAARPLSERSAALRACGRLLIEHADELAPLLTREQGKPLGKARGEIVYGAADWFETTAALPVATDHIRNTRLTTSVRWVPFGLVAAITPWNFPIALAVWKLAPALLAGNGVILKPSPFTPLATMQMCQLFSECLPSGLVAVVPGNDDVGAALVEHPGIDKVAFTGSVASGISVASAASRRLLPVTMELGGNDAALVLDDADLQRDAEKMFWAAFANNGQACTAIKRLYVAETRMEELIARFAKLAGGVRHGDGLDPNSTLGPMANEEQFNRVRGLVAAALNAGAIARFGGMPQAARGYFYPLTLLTNVDPSMAIVSEEQFGPALPVIPFCDERVAIENANATRYGLGGSIWSTDAERVAKIAPLLRCGTVWVNHHGPVFPEVPFGGWGLSGLGVEHGEWGLKELLRPQAIYEEIRI